VCFSVHTYKSKMFVCAHANHTCLSVHMQVTHVCPHTSHTRRELFPVLVVCVCEIILRYSYVRIHVFEPDIYLRLYLFSCIHTHTHTHKHVFPQHLVGRSYVSPQTHMYVCIYIICIYVYIHLHTPKYLYVHT
jgi:hypothetical protein